MEIPFYAILVIYLIIIGIFLILAFFNVYHLIKYSMFDLRSKIILFLFIILSIACITLALYATHGVDWWQPLLTLSI